MCWPESIRTALPRRARIRAVAATGEKKYHVGLAKGEVGEYVLVPGDPGRTPMIAKYLDDAKEVAFSREYRTFTGSLDGVPVSAMSTGSEERRVGKECRSRWSPYHSNKNNER